MSFVSLYLIYIQTYFYKNLFWNDLNKPKIRSLLPFFPSSVRLTRRLRGKYLHLASYIY